ncbi:MAG: 3-hydroxyacyl-ACP dehydratase FabZ [Desulfatibacillaceae bacterium]|nr:3-hydroxyacyl-ACP dehydratase FabZ [Desulfatibacillaceae bacterium]
MQTICDIKRILQVLPHRYPFVLVDRIVELVLGEKITGIKNVTYNEAFFQGHFPDEPIMPGVLIVEAMGQTGGVLACLTHEEELGGQPIYFTGMDRVRFRRPVRPGDQLVLDVSFLKRRKNLIKMAGSATVDGNLCAEAELMAVWGA